MADPESELSQDGPRRSGLPGAFLVLLLVVAAGIGGVLMFLRQPAPEKKSETEGFDIAELPEDKAAPRPAVEPSATEPSPSDESSGLSMVTGAPAGMQMGAKVAAPPARGASGAAAFADAVRRSEGKLNALAEAYTRRYPVIAKYGEDWMSHPDLKKLNDDYMEDHDPIKFMRGLAKSPSFTPMVKKYATQREVQAFVGDAVKNAPADVMKAAMAYLKEDPLVKNLVSSVVSALGLPPGILGAAEGGKVDEKQVIDSMMKSNPGLEQLMQNPEMQKALQKQGSEKKKKR